MVNVSIGSAPVGVEQLSDQHIQNMAPQTKKTASSKKKAAVKKSPPRKTAPKKKQTNLRDLEEDKEFTDVTLAFLEEILLLKEENRSERNERRQGVH